MNNNKKLLLALSVGIFSILSGCQNLSPEPEPREPIHPQHFVVTGIDHKTERQIAQAAESISDSLLKLAAIQQAATPPVKGHKLPPTVIPGLMRLGTIEWSGPIGPLVERIAMASSFKYSALGHAPAIPVLVNISAKNQPLASILRNAAYQAGKKAMVSINSDERTIELRYAVL